MEQICIFNNDNSPEREMYRNVKKKRVHYKTTTYTKSYKNDVIHKTSNVSHPTIPPTEGANVTIKDDNATWGRMNELRLILGNLFLYPILSNIPDEYIDIGIIRTYKSVYTAEKYLYKGDDGITRIYKGQDFEVREAEIIGTEDLGINERVWIHQLLIDYIESGYKIEQLNQWIEELVNWFQHGFTVELLYITLFTLKCPNDKGLQSI